MLAWPLTGRVEELSFVAEALCGEQTRGVVIAGALGVGKTRLAREAVTALDDSYSVEWVAATPAAATIPFGALAHLVGDHAVGGPDDRLRLVRGITAALEQRAAGRRTVLAVDDAQWLDPGGAAAVHQLVVTGKAKALFTLRTEEPAPAPIVACWKDGWAERLELQPLSSLDLRELVRDVVHRPVDPITLDRLWSLTKGNPLFVHELLRGALETGAFTVSDGVWSWTGPGGAASRLPEILESRLSRVSRPGRQVLDTLAIGEPLRVEVLQHLHGVDPLVEVERLGLARVEELEDERVRLCHPVYGEALRSAMGTVERRGVTSRLAAAMTELSTMPRAEQLRVAVWQLESGAALSSALLTDAAHVANAMYDYRLAERLARHAVATGAELAASLVLGDALNRQGRCVEGLAILDPLAARARTDDEHVAVAVARHFGLTTELGFRPEFAAELFAAEQRISDPRSVAFLRALRASLLSSAGRLDDGVALAKQTVAEHPDEVTQLRAVSPLVGAWLCSGRPDEACAMTERMLEPALRLREQVPQAPGWVMSLHLPGLVLAGRLDDAENAIALIEAVTASAVANPDMAALLAFARGMTSLQRGQVRTAHDSLRQSVALMRPIARWRLPFVLVQLVEAAALVGDADTAASASEEADELVVHHAVFEGAARYARGWAALARGERSAALDLFLEAAEWAGAHGQHTAELIALHNAARFGGVRQASERLQAVAAASEGRWAPVFAAHARALAAGEGEGLETVAASFDEMGAKLLAAETSAEASAAFKAAGLLARTDRATARAWQLAASCEGARSPVLDELGRPLPLTRREREVATIAAEGLTSKAIAERLFLSVRTVEGHLQNAYGKLGVNDRAGLASVLERGLDE